MEDKKSLKEKLKAHLPHKKGAEKKQTGTEDTGFTIRLARFIIEKRAWIESVFIAGCIFCAVAMLFVNVNYDLICSFHGPVQHGTGCDEEGVWISGNSPVDVKGCKPVRSKAIQR